MLSGTIILSIAAKYAVVLALATVTFSYAVYQIVIA